MSTVIYVWVYEDEDGEMEIANGVTRATRIAKLDPNGLVPVLIVGKYKRKKINTPRIGDLI